MNTAGVIQMLKLASSTDWNEKDIQNTKTLKSAGQFTLALIVWRGFCENKNNKMINDCRWLTKLSDYFRLCKW